MGKRIGGLPGSLLGPLGVLLRGVCKQLYDAVKRWARWPPWKPCSARAAAALRAEGGGAAAADSGPSRRPGATAGCAPISAFQLSFLSSLVGLSIAVANADGRAQLREVDALKRFFRESFPYAEEDQRLLGRLVDRTFLARERLAVDELARHLLGASTPAGRRLLVRLLLKIAAADGPRVSPAGQHLIRRIAQTLRLTEAEYEGLAAEFLAPAGWEYQVLGVKAGAGEEEVRSAYRRLVSENHPDRFSRLGVEFVRAAEERFKILQEAYEELRRKRGLPP